MEDLDDCDRHVAEILGLPPDSLKLDLTKPDIAGSRSPVGGRERGRRTFTMVATIAVSLVAAQDELLRAPVRSPASVGRSSADSLAEVLLASRDHTPAVTPSGPGSGVTSRPPIAQTHAGRWRREGNRLEGRRGGALAMERARATAGRFGRRKSRRDFQLAALPSSTEFGAHAINSQARPSPAAFGRGADREERLVEAERLEAIDAVRLLRQR